MGPGGRDEGDEIMGVGARMGDEAKAGGEQEQLEEKGGRVRHRKHGGLGRSAGRTGVGQKTHMQLADAGDIGAGQRPHDELVRGHPACPELCQLSARIYPLRPGDGFLPHVIPRVLLRIVHYPLGHSRTLCYHCAAPL